MFCGVVLLIVLLCSAERKAPAATPKAGKAAAVTPKAGKAAAATPKAAAQKKTASSSSSEDSSSEDEAPTKVLKLIHNTQPLTRGSIQKASPWRRADLGSVLPFSGHNDYRSVDRRDLILNQQSHSETICKYVPRTHKQDRRPRYHGSCVVSDSLPS